jgi:hypothetical protein
MVCNGEVLSMPGGASAETEFHTARQERSRGRRETGLGSLCSCRGDNFPRWCRTLTLCTGTLAFGNPETGATVTAERIAEVDKITLLVGW